MIHDLAASETVAGSGAISFFDAIGTMGRISAWPNVRSRNEGYAITRLRLCKHLEQIINELAITRQIR
jgi:hypothetical protein